MKKYIVFSLLCGLIGATYLQAVSLERQWACRNTRRPISKSTQLRLTKNKCTNAEIEAGKELSVNLVTAAIVGVPMAAVAVAGGANIAATVKRQKKLKSKYGENWQKSCEKIVDDPEIELIYREECRRLLARRKQAQ